MFINSTKPAFFARLLVGGETTPASIWPAASAVKMFGTSSSGSTW
jgi:hypothetical protein